MNEKQTILPSEQAEIERQGLEKYLAGDYQLGVLNDQGQHISIPLPKKIRPSDKLFKLVKAE